MNREPSIKSLVDNDYASDRRIVDYITGSDCDNHTETRKVIVEYLIT